MIACRFLDWEDATNPANGLPITGRDHLTEILRRSLNRPPYLCELEGEHGFNLAIGVGPLGCVQYGRADGTHFQLALAYEPYIDEESLEFWAGGQPTEMLRQNLLPFDRVIEIAGYFLETGLPSPSVAWEQI